MTKVIIRKSDIYKNKKSQAEKKKTSFASTNCKTKSKIDQFVIMSKDNKWIYNHSRAEFEELERVLNFTVFYYFRSYIFENEEDCKESISWNNYYKDSLVHHLNIKTKDNLEKGMIIRPVEIVFSFDIKED